MGKIFSDVVEQALEYVFYNERAQRGKEGFAMLEQASAAGGGELAAYYDVGHAYEQGEGVEKDEAEAVRWYQARLDHGMHVGCCNALGALYFYGKAVEQDYAKAFQLINWAYSQGNNWGIYYLGVMYFHGWGVQQDYVKAREILEKVT